MISETERLRKQRARQRARREREALVAEAADLLISCLGDRLHTFCALCEQIDPMKLRVRLLEIIDQMPEPEPLTIDEETIARLRQERSRRPHSSGGFVLDRVK